MLSTKMKEDWCDTKLEAGVPITVVSRKLSHTTTGMTEKHYIALSEEYKEEQCEKPNMVLNQLSLIG